MGVLGLRGFVPSICKQPVCKRCGKLAMYVAVLWSFAGQTGRRTVDPGNGEYWQDVASILTGDRPRGNNKCDVFCGDQERRLGTKA